MDERLVGINYKVAWQKNLAVNPSVKESLVMLRVLVERVAGGGHWVRPTFFGLLGQDAACTGGGAFGHVDDVLAFHFSCHASPLHCWHTSSLISWLTHN